LERVVSLNLDREVQVSTECDEDYFEGILRGLEGDFLIVEGEEAIQYIRSKDITSIRVLISQEE
jgi:hypothetical protein